MLDAGGRSVEVADPAEPGEIVRLCLRPEDVTLSAGRPEAGGSSARNHLAGRVAARDGRPVRMCASLWTADFRSSPS